MGSELTDTGKLEICERAVLAAKVTTAAAVELCVRLDDVYQSRAFEVSQYGDEDLFLKSCGLKRDGHLSRLKTIGRGIRQHDLPMELCEKVGSVSHLYYVCREKTRERALELLEKAQTMNREDLVKDATGQDKCAHEWEEVPMRVCRKCPAMQRCG